MKKWDLKLHYEDPDERSYFTSACFSPTSDLLIGGLSNGNLVFFERCVDGRWTNIRSSTVCANSKKLDLAKQCFADQAVVDSDFVPVQRKCPMLITAGSMELKLWFISDHLEPTAPPNFVPNGLEFPPVEHTKRALTANHVTSIEAEYGYRFNSVRCCPDGMNFAYTQHKSVYVRRIDRIEPCLKVFNAIAEPTKIDYSPIENEILLVGDAHGNGNIVDMRVQPTQNIPNFKANAAQILSKRFKYVIDCGFSNDGTKFEPFDLSNDGTKFLPFDLSNDGM